MRIAFDATTLHPPQTGVGYYTENLLNGLLEAAPEHEWVLLSHRPLESRWATLSQPVPVDGYLSVRNLWLQWKAPRLLARLGPDLAHFTNSLIPWRTATPCVVTVHDMTLALFAHWHPWRRRLTLPLVIDSMKKAHRVITVSQTSRRDIVREARISADKVVVIPAAPGPEFRRIEHARELERVQRRYQLPERFVLFVGTIEPRKNLARLVDVFLSLPAELQNDFPLLIAGAPGWGEARLRRALARGTWSPEVRWLGYVPREDLPLLLNRAELFVFPSLYEGFGLPVVEAMACGAPVITSDTSSLKELFSEAALLVDPHDSQELRRALTKALESGDLRQELRAKSQIRAADFSWAEAARRTLEVYAQVIH